MLHCAMAGKATFAVGGIFAHFNDGSAVPGNLRKKTAAQECQGIGRAAIVRTQGSPVAPASKSTCLLCLNGHQSQRDCPFIDSAGTF